MHLTGPVTRVHIAIVARFLIRPLWRNPRAAVFVRAALRANRRATPPADAPFTCAEPTPADAARNPFGGLMDNVVNIRDFKRREERIAEVKRFAARLCELGDQVRDTAPCEMPPVQPMYVAPEKDPA